ncbi:MAG: DUF6161 domain-containing protein [Bacteroidota bacterium]
MTLTEFRRLSNESINATWLNDVNTTFNFPYINSSIPLKGASSVYEFVLKQIEGWEKLGENLPAELSESKRYFTIIRNHLDGLIISHRDADINQLQNIWNSNVNAVIASSMNLFPLKFNSPEVEFLLKVYQEYPSSFNSAFSFITSPSNINYNNKESFIGAILAYEFTLKDASKIVKRGAAERGSLKVLENELETHFSEAENDLSEHIKMINDKYTEFTQKIDDLKNTKEKAYDDWFNKTSSNFNEFDNNSSTAIKSLETSYEELLRLKKPAEYWKSRAIELKKEGKTSLNWVIALVVIAVTVLYTLLWLTPDVMMKSFFSDDRSTAVRWSIIFITLISFLAFGIKVLVKISFSSFHLSRDAEERERLTYVYLAMVKDSSIDKEDRHLIMQSLFSRADTGLLKDDSSPTMPGAGSLFDKFK